MSDKGQFGILLKKRQKHVTHPETRERHPLTLDDACITLFCWKCNHILFLSVWRVSLVVVQFVTYELFFPFFSLSSPKNYSLTLLVIGILILFFILWIFQSKLNFNPSLFLFNFIFQSQFIKYYIL